MNRGLDTDSMARLSAIEGDETFTDLFKGGQVGGCVNSVAHDLNNYLGAVLSYAELVGMEGDLPDETCRMLGEITHAVQKSTGLLNTLTAIARKESPNAVMTDMNLFVDRVLDLRRYDLRTGRVQVDVSTRGDVGMLVIDEPKLIRAMLSVLTNAFEHVQGEKPANVHIQVDGERDCVRIGVRDSGPPIPEDDRPFIFEPFFTTKGDGHLGLGLTHAADVAQLHAGDLNYDPETGFVFVLPRDNGLGGFK